MSIGHLYVLFGEVSIQVLSPLFNWVDCFFGVEFCKVFINFGYYQMYQQICSPILGMSFLLLMFSFAVQTLFSLM